MSTREDWQRRLGPLYGGAVALVHSTPWRWPTEVTDEARSPGWIVALGVPIGFVAWAVAALARAAGIPVEIAALLGLAMLSLASAALVERGLAERIDQWDSTESRSRTGGPAVLVLVFVTLIRAFAIVGVVHRHDWLLVFIAVAVTGRWGAIFLQAIGDTIDHDDARRSLVAKPAPAWLTAALSLGAAALAVIAVGKVAILALALTAAAAFALGLHAQRREHGLSGPTVAMVAAIGELLLLLVATIR